MKKKQLSLPKDLINREDFEEKEIALDKIYLDPNNPRFSTSRKISDDRITDDGIQKKTLEKIKCFGVDDLKDSIRKIGFLQIDKIVVRPLTNGEYVVVEGNRRVAALRGIIKEYEGGELEIGKTISKEVLSGIKKFKAVVYNGKEKDMSLIIQGIRHLSGIREWSGLQKGELVYKLVKEKGLTELDTARATVMSGSEVVRYLRSYYVWLQFIGDEEYGKNFEDDPDNFSLILEGIFRSETIKGWLKWNEEKKIFTNNDEIKKFLSWTLSINGAKPRLKGAKEVTRLGNLKEKYPELFREFESDENKNGEWIQRQLWEKEQTPIELNEWLRKLKEFKSDLENLPDVKIKLSQNKKEFTALLEKIKALIDEHLKTLDG